MKREEQYNVIVFGLGNTARDSIEYIKIRFNIIGCSDNDLLKYKTADELGFKFINPNDLINMEYDYILVASVCDDEISKSLIEDKGIPKEKVLCRIQWCRMIFHYSFGNLNEDKTFYVLSRPIHTRDGMFSFLFSFLEQMCVVEVNDYIPIVDMKNYPNQYLEDNKIGIENSWEYYYEPLSDYSLDEVYASKNVILGYDESCYKGNYDKRYDLKNMGKLYGKYIKYNNNLKSIIDKEYIKYIDASKKTLGVLYRGSDMSALKLKKHSIQPDFSEMRDLIYKYMDEWKCERIFLSTEDAEAADKFKEEFGEILTYTDQKRFRNTGNKWLSQINFDRDNDQYLRGVEYIVTIELLSRCNNLLAGICAGSVCAQIINNGRYEHIKMVDKGEYI